MKNKKTFLINVTEADIKHGTPKIPDSCMVTLAVRRALKDETAFCGWQIHAKGYVSKFVSPRVQEKIEKFDGGIKVEPFSFKITLNKAHD